MLPRVTAVVGSGACSAFLFSQAAIATTADATARNGIRRTGMGFGGETLQGIGKTYAPGSGLEQNGAPERRRRRVHLLVVRVGRGRCWTGRPVDRLTEKRRQEEKSAVRRPTSDLRYPP